MIKNIKITLTNGQKYKLRNPDTLSEIDCSRTAIFLFDDMNVYTGCSDGLLDEDEDFCIFVPGKNHGIGMPFRRLVGWAYKKLNAEEIIARMAEDVKAGKDIEEVVDMYCTCKTQKLRQQLIAGIQKIVGIEMRLKAMNDGTRHT